MRDYEEKSYYEIQLDNKQLILVFLASVTVCVLIFVLGVMVGKGKKEAEMASMNEQDQTITQEETKPPQPVQTDQEEPKRNKKKGKEEKAAVADEKEESKESESNKEDYSFYDLDKPENDDDRLIEDTPKTKVADKKTSESEKAPESKSADSKTASTNAEAVDAATKEAAKKPGLKYTVQVMATSSESKARQQLATLKTKGYTAFMDEDKNGNTTVYKVRVGRFDNHDTAKKIAGNLKTELKLETWVAVLE